MKASLHKRLEIPTENLKQIDFALWRLLPQPHHHEDSNLSILPILSSTLFIMQNQTLNWYFGLLVLCSWALYTQVYVQLGMSIVRMVIS
jgi:hypothetical protein